MLYLLAGLSSRVVRGLEGIYESLGGVLQSGWEHWEVREMAQAGWDTTAGIDGRDPGNVGWVGYHGG